jgi:outer membrane protein assembly factor BamA
MASIARMSFLAVSFTVGGAMAASVPETPTYILNGYSLSGIHGLNAPELEAKLKDKPGARISQADIHADTMIVAKELEARHIKGQLFTTLAEKNGRVWIIFDLLNPDAGLRFGQLDTQNFEGASHVSASVLAAATGLKKGEQLSRQNLAVAAQAISAAYAKAMPGKKILLKIRRKNTPDGKTTLTWIIGEPK